MSLLDHFIQSGMEFWAQICWALAIALLFCGLDGIRRKFSACVRLEFMRSGANIFQKVFKLWENRKAAILFFDARYSNFSASDVLIYNYSTVEAERIIQRSFQILLLLDQSNASRIVLITWFH